MIISPKFRSRYAAAGTLRSTAILRDGSNRLKIAIYNLHFATLGGGDRRTSALAAHLAKQHHVTLFVRSPVSIDAAKTFFGIDLSGVEIISLENKDHSVEIARGRFDLLINNSHCSNLPN